MPHSTYTSYDILVEPTYVYRYGISVELFSPWQALGVKCLAYTVTGFEPTLAQANRLMGEHSPTTTSPTNAILKCFIIYNTLVTYMLC